MLRKTYFSAKRFGNFKISVGQQGHTSELWCLRVSGIGVADRLADPQGEQSLVAGVGQRVDGLGEHAR